MAKNGVWRNFLFFVVFLLTLNELWQTVLATKMNTYQSRWTQEHETKKSLEERSSKLKKMESNLKEFYDDDENENCTACPVGTFSNQQKNPNCTDVCSPGFCPDVKNCSLCLPGTYNNQINASFCPECPDGSWSDWGSTNCSTCSPGYQPNSRKSGCVACLPGFYSRNGNSCLPCGPGYYSNKEGAISCFICLPGSYSDREAQPACTPCGKGAYNPKQGSSSRFDCLECPAGYYCPEDTTVFPIPCQEGYKCPKGTGDEIPCPSLYESPPSSSDCSPSPIFYILIVLAFLACLVVVFATIVCVRTSNYAEIQRRSSIKQAEEEKKRLIPQPDEGPMYSGL